MPTIWIHISREAHNHLGNHNQADNSRPGYNKDYVQIPLSEDVYLRLANTKWRNETWSDVILRLGQTLQ